MLTILQMRVELVLFFTNHEDRHIFQRRTLTDVAFAVEVLRCVAGGLGKVVRAGAAVVAGQNIDGTGGLHPTQLHWVATGPLARRQGHCVERRGQVTASPPDPVTGALRAAGGDGVRSRFLPVSEGAARGNARNEKGPSHVLIFGPS